MSAAHLADDAVPAGGNLAAARALAHALASEGAHVFLSPGSRNTPLSVAFDELALTTADVALHVVLDERAAAFAALGAGRTGAKPAILVCTSGTAGGHYLPAVMEAHMGRIPLIVLTADRPPEAHHCGAPQTIVQQRLFDGYTRWFADLPTPDGELTSRRHRWLGAMATRARNAAMGAPAGPVHMNVPFRKPLLDDGARPNALRTADARDALGGQATRSMRTMRGDRRLDEASVAELAETLEQTEGGVVFCGPRTGDVDGRGLSGAVHALAERLGWPVVADGVSGVRRQDATTIHHADAVARANVMPSADLVVRFGGAPTNKAVASWIATVPESILIDEAGVYADPDVRSDHLVIADPVVLCAELTRALPPRSGPSAWLRRWQALDAAAQHALDVAPRCAGIEAARAVAQLSGPIHVASSMAVRDFDAVARTEDGTRVTSNRGVNGIDGTIATALGIAFATGERTTVLLGDLALAHDVSGLLAAGRAGAPMNIVVVNNDGGSIFEMLPVAGELDRQQFERLFATPQALDVAAIAHAAGAAHRSVTGDELHAALREEGTTLRVFEVVQDRPRERALREAMWHHVIDALQRAGAR